MANPQALNYDSKVYCYCQQRSEGDMIECDNPDVMICEDDEDSADLSGFISVALG